MVIIPSGVHEQGGLCRLIHFIQLQEKEIGKKTPLFKIFNENIQKHSVKWLQLIFVDLVTCK